MKIIKEDQNSIVLRERGLFNYVIGLVFFAVGLLMIIRPSFIIDNGVKGLAIGIVFVIFGLLLIIFNQWVSVSFDKRAGKLLVKKTSPVKRAIEEYNFAQLKEICFRPSLEVSSKRNRVPGKARYSYEIYFVLENGEEVSLGADTNERRARGNANKIATFLNLNIKEQGLPSQKDIVSLFKEVINGKNSKDQLDNNRGIDKIDN